MGQTGALTVLEPTFSTKHAAGPILVTVLGMVAEMERKFIRERQLWPHGTTDQTDCCGAHHAWGGQGIRSRGSGAGLTGPADNS
jgi:hypothetical protein